MANNSNPYYIKPATADISPVLQGIGSLVKESREKAKKEKFKQDYLTAYQKNDPNALAEFMASNPDSGDSMQEIYGFRTEATKGNYVDSISGFLANPTQDNIGRLAKARSAYVKAQGGDPRHTDAAPEAFAANPEGFIREMENNLAGLDKNRWDAYKTQKGMGGEGQPSTVQEWQFFNKLPKEDQTRFLNMKRQGYTVKDIGGVPTVVPLTPGEEAVPLSTLDAEAAAAAKIEGSKEGAKLKVQRKFKPQIEKAVTTARIEAKNRGNIFNELNHAKAALPGLTDAVDQLKELASVATSTFGGRVFDAAVRETGFGATKGGTARAKFVSIINNQVLPLLKPTFGGSFSVQEGESLKATMGDPNLSPEEKIAQLNAFIAQKMRDIEAKEVQLGSTQQGNQIQEGATIGRFQVEVE